MLSFRMANKLDVELYFNWANDPLVRQQSFNSDIIDFEKHKKWFESKTDNNNYFMLIFQNDEKLDIGQIRIQKENNQEALISISIAKEFRGNGYAKEMLKLATDYFLGLNHYFLINAFIKTTNLGSKYAFEKAGFEFKKIINYKNVESYHYVKTINK